MSRLDFFDPRMVKWANMLVNHSLGTQFTEKNSSIEGKMVLVMGETGTRELMESLEYAILEKGANPILMPHFPTHPRNYNVGVPAMEIGTEEQQTFVPESFKAVFEEAGAFIYVLGSDETRILEPFSKQVGTVRRSNQELLKTRLSKPWCLTLFPLKSDSDFEGFSSFGEYQQFIINASVVDYAVMYEQQEELKALMTGAKTVTVRSYNPNLKRILELNMEIGHNEVENCSGKHNVPDGEVYTSPNWNTIQGEIYLDVPVYQNGSDLGGVYLKIVDGQIVKSSAQVGPELLQSILDTDEGAKHMGEIAVGTNAAVQRNLKHPLFAEKIGGTIHMAIGKSYEDRYPEYVSASAEDKPRILQELQITGRYNQSGQHIDIPKDFRNPQPGEALYIGDTEIKWNGEMWRPVN
jgi:aminopeptidase